MTAHAEVIWVTGASSGIGQALAQSLLQEGHQLVVSARNADRLQQIYAGQERVSILPFDVTDAEQIPRVRAHLQYVSPYLDRVILNAGHCEYFEADAPDWHLFSRLMAINYHGALHCLEAAWPLLQVAERPHLVGISSQAASLPFTRAQGYGASKAALSYCLESLHLDVQDWLDVSVVQPGFVDTPLTRQNDFTMPFLLTTEQAVRHLRWVLQARPRRSVFPKRLQGLLWLLRQWPGAWLRYHRSSRSY